MRRIMVFFMICIICVCCLTSAYAVSIGEFDVTLPDGWVEGFTEGESTFYFRNSNLSIDDGVIIMVIEKLEFLNDEILSDMFLSALYNWELQNISTIAIDGKANSIETMFSGKQALVYWYLMETNGIQYSVAGIDIATGEGIFELTIIHPDMTPDELKELALSIGETIRYNVTENTEQINDKEAVISFEDLPKADNPYLFTPVNTVGMDLLAPQWMMNEYTRGLCTKYLELDLFLENPSIFSSFPLNVYESRIGLSDDTIWLIIQSLDKEIAFIVLYNTMEQNALFYTEMWNENTLTTFVQNCTDQFYVNTYAGIENANRLFMEAINNE